jgi:hypothetical protein
MQFSPVSYHFIPLWSTYPRQYPVLKYLQSVLSFNVRENPFGTTKYMPIQCNVQIMKLIIPFCLESCYFLPLIYLSIYLSIYLWLYSPCGLWPFQFLNLYTVGRTPWTGDQHVARLLPTQRTTQTQKILTQTSMPRVGFEPMIPVFERAKMVHGLDRAATVIGISFLLGHNIQLNTLYSDTLNLHSSHVYLLCLEFEPVVPYSSRSLYAY